MDAFDRDDRNLAIIARAVEAPWLTLEEIGREFGGLSTGMVSLILNGLRGSAHVRRAAAKLADDQEQAALIEILAIVGPLNQGQAQRVLLHALTRRCGLECPRCSVSTMR